LNDSDFGAAGGNWLIAAFMHVMEPPSKRQNRSCTASLVGLLPFTANVNAEAPVFSPDHIPFVPCACLRTPPDSFPSFM